MKFKEDDKIIYCKNDYKKEFDNNGSCFYKNIHYWKGYVIHKENGPALNLSGGYKFWYLNGKGYSERNYLKIINFKNKSKVLDEI
jgi:hypothetical protein